MPFVMGIGEAQAEYEEFQFVAALPLGEQKAAFHVRDANGQDLCLKIIAPNYSLDRLQREILALQSLSHPNVVRLKEYTLSTKRGSHRHYMIEEFVEGTDLSEQLGSSQGWSRPRASRFFAAVCDGLDALRAINVVHRDLKPSNIRVRPDGTPVIIDFGLARHLSLPDLTSTAEGAAIGTPAYFAPEQFVGTKHDIDHRTDLFALGILLHEALLAVHPFYVPEMSYDTLRQAVCESSHYLEASRFSALPDDWQLLLTRLLEKQRVRRPHTAGEVARLLRILEDL
jgi:serine/threonine protein kinase